MMLSTLKTSSLTWLSASKVGDLAPCRADGASLRAMSLVALALSVALAGCGDDKPVNPGGADASVDGAVDAGVDSGIDGGGLEVDSTGPQAKLTFNIAHAKGNGLVDPVDAEILDLSLDKYPGLADPGFQIDIQINGINVPEGTEVDVQVDGKSVGKVKMSGGTAELTKVTLECTASQSAISVVATISGSQVTTAKAAKLDCGDGCTAALVPVNGCIVEDADPATPGLQATFQITSTTPDCTHAQLRVTDVSGKIQETPKVALVAGKATVTATVAADTTGVINETATVVAIVVDDAHAERPKGQSDALDVPVTTDAPNVAIVAPNKALLTLADDADGNDANGVQVTIVGTATTMTPSDIEKLVVKVDGVEVGKTSMKLNGGFEFDLSFATSKTWDVTVEATNACGLAGTGKRSYQVAASKAKLTITSPASGAVLNAKNDTDASTSTVLETSFDIALQGAADGTKVSVFCRSNQAGSPYPATPNGTAIVSGGAATLAVPLSIDATAIGTSVVCVARDNGANPSESPEVALTVGLPPPCMTIKLPAEGFVTAAATLAVGATATGLEGAVVEAKLSLQGGATFIDTPIGKIKDGAFTGSLALTVGSPPVPVPHGTYELKLNAVDSYGNAVADGLCSTLTRIIAIDRNPPVLTLAIPTKQILDPKNDADSDDIAPGYQTKVVFSLSGESEITTSTVCATVNGFEMPCQSVKGNGLVTFPSVTLQPGANVIVASAKDSLGNASKDVIVNITLQSNAAIVKWLKPAVNVFIAADSLDIELSVTDKALGVAVNGAAMTLVVNGQEVNGLTFASTGNGTYGAKVNGLKIGANTLQVTALPVGAEAPGVSPALTVTRKADQPGIALQGFTNGEAVNLAKAACIPGLTDCIANVSATTTGAADGSAATLVVACDLAATVTATATVANGVAVFSSITLPHAAKCTLTPSVVDEAGQAAVGAAVSLTVDRVAPKLFSIIPNKLLFLAADDVNGNPADGVQLQLSVQVVGIPATSDVNLSVADDTGKVVSTAKTGVHGAISDGQPATLSFGLVTLPGGTKVGLTLTTADAAGNTATLTLTVVVVADAPEIRIVAPSSLDGKSCSTKADCGSELCHQGKCTMPWAKNTTKTLSVALLGVLPGAKLRICSDNGNIIGATCAHGGKQVVESAIDATLSGSLEVKTLPDGLHTVTAELLLNGKDAAVNANWVSSQTAALSNTRKRRILLDTIAPVIKTIAPPVVAGMPTSCLSRSAQVALDGLPGGSFSFAITMEGEDATVVMLAGPSQVGSATTSAKVGALTAKVANEGSTAFTAIATDEVGNESAAISAGTYEVNTIPPIGQFSAPTKATLLNGDSLDVRIASSSVDVEAQPVTLKDGDKTIGSVAITKGEALFSHALYQTLADGSHTLTATISDACANTSIIATSPTTVSVDTQAPTLTIATPTAAQAFGDADDAKANVGGYQVSTTFTTGGAKSWKVELGTDCDANFAGCAGFAQVAAGDVTNAGGAEPAVFVTVPFGKTKQYSLRVSATDVSGNVTSVERGFAVQLSGCLVSVSGLPASGIVNTALCATPGQNCASVKLPLQASFVGPCGNIDALQVLVDGAAKDSKAPANSAATLEITVTDGTKPKVEVKALEGASTKGSTGESSLVVDLTHPVASFIAGTVLGATTPASGSTNLVGQTVDRDTGKNGHQVHLLLQTVDAGLSGGKFVSVKETVAGADLSAGLGLPSNFAASGTVATELKFVTLKEDAANTVEATVADAAGNTGKATIAIEVDWVPPAAIQLAAFDSAKGDLNPRRPFAKLNFAAVAEDGASGGAADKYEVAYSRAEITKDNFDNACKASALPKTVLPKPGAPGAAEAVVVEGPDGRAATDACKFATLTDNGTTKYFFAVRAVDAAGNAGAISNVLSTADLRLRYAKWTSTVAPWNQPYTFAHPTFIGDVNGDGLQDAMLGGRNGAKSCVVYGHANADLSVADLDIKAQSAATHTCFDNTVALGVQTVGLDANGDGVGDLVVSFGQGSGVKREVHVYLGEKGKALATTPALKVTNITYNVVAGIRALAAVGNMNGDVATGNKPIQDFAFTVTATPSVLEERVFVVPGSTSWSTASPKTLDIESATDRATHNVLLIKRSDYAGTPAFGIGLSGGGNILRDNNGTGQQFDDLLIVQNAGTQGIYIVRGRSWTGATNVLLSNNLDSGSADDKSAAVLRPGFTGINTFQSPILVEYDGDGIPDIAVAHAPANEVTYLHWASGKAIDGVASGIVPLNASLLPGQSDFYKTNNGFAKVAPVQFIYPAGDFGNVGDGSTAIASVRPSWSVGGRLTVGVRSALVRTGSAAGTTRSYEVEDWSIPNVFAPGATTMGNFTLATNGDFNGDGYPDLVISTYSSGLAILAY